MYFSKFPVIPYDAIGKGDFRLVTNLLKRVRFRMDSQTSSYFYDTYDVRNGETPEMLADKLYDDSELHWVILFVNNITDRYSQWVLSTNQFLTFVNEKYGTTLNDVHHYEVFQSSGDTTVKIDIGQDRTGYADNDIFTITNFEYEEKRQDELRKIKLLKPDMVNGFVQNFERKIKESVL